MKVLMAGLFGFLVLLVGLGVSWALTCGLYYLVTLCFGLEFNWLIGTGVWLLWWVAKSIFGRK